MTTFDIIKEQIIAKYEPSTEREKTLNSGNRYLLEKSLDLLRDDIQAKNRLYFEALLSFIFASTMASAIELWQKNIVLELFSMVISYYIAQRLHLARIVGKYFNYMGHEDDSYHILDTEILRKNISFDACCEVIDELRDQIKNEQGKICGNKAIIATSVSMVGGRMLGSIPTVQNLLPYNLFVEVPPVLVKSAISVTGGIMGLTAATRLIKYEDKPITLFDSTMNAIIAKYEPLNRRDTPFDNSTRQLREAKLDYLKSLLLTKNILYFEALMSILLASAIASAIQLWQKNILLELFSMAISYYIAQNFRLFRNAGNSINYQIIDKDYCNVLKEKILDQDISFSDCIKVINQLQDNIKRVIEKLCNKNALRGAIVGMLSGKIVCSIPAVQNLLPYSLFTDVLVKSTISVSAGTAGLAMNAGLLNQKVEPTRLNPQQR